MRGGDRSCCAGRTRTSARPARIWWRASWDARSCRSTSPSWRVERKTWRPGCEPRFLDNASRGQRCTSPASIGSARPMGISPATSRARWASWPRRGDQCSSMSLRRPTSRMQWIAAPSPASTCRTRGPSSSGLVAASAGGRRAGCSRGGGRPGLGPVFAVRRPGGGGRARPGAAGRGIDGGSRLTAELLSRAAREAADRSIAALAQRLQQDFEWDDLVLPAPVARRLREIASALARRQRVYGDWGFRRRAGGFGIRVLFSGPSGTGKTMAVEVIACELGLELYKHRPLARWSASTSARRRRTSTHLPRGGRVERHPLLRRSRRALRQAVGGQGRARSLRQHRDRATFYKRSKSSRASCSWPPT